MLFYVNLEIGFVFEKQYLFHTELFLNESHFFLSKSLCKDSRKNLNRAIMLKYFFYL